MKVSWNDLSLEERLNFGNGCTVVFDFIFTASCRQHDFNFSRGSEVWYKAPYWYTKANWDFFTHMWQDAQASSRPVLYSCVSLVYFIGVMIFSWPLFKAGRWRTKEEIILRDKLRKMRRGIM